MLLARFHAGACFPVDVSSCTDGFSDPVRQQIAHDHQEAVMNEVMTNLNRTSECFTEEFRTNINKDLLVGIGDNHACLKSDGNTQSQSGCMVDATLAFIRKRFPDWDWLVVCLQLLQ